MFAIINKIFAFIFHRTADDDIEYQWNSRHFINSLFIRTCNAPNVVQKRSDSSEVKRHMDKTIKYCTFVNMLINTDYITYTQIHTDRQTHILLAVMFLVLALLVPQNIRFGNINSILHSGKLSTFYAALKMLGGTYYIEFNSIFTCMNLFVYV